MSRILIRLQLPISRTEFWKSIVNNFKKDGCAFIALSGDDALWGRAERWGYSKPAEDLSSQKMPPSF